MNIVSDVDITTHWWDTGYPFVVRVHWKQWVLVEAYFKTREEQDEYAKQLRSWKDAGRLAVSHNEHGIPYLEYIQQRNCDLVLLRQFTFLGERQAPRWCSVKWIQPFTEERKRELEEARNAPEMRMVERMFGATQEVEDDRLFWRMEVENAPAEAEAR